MLAFSLSNPIIMNLQDLVHLMNRAGFGLTLDDARRFEGRTMGEVVGLLLDDSKEFTPLTFLPDPRPQEGELDNLRVLTQLLKSRKDLRALNVAWINKMGASKAVLREKMTLFWHNHFATSTPLAFLMQMQNNTIRNHALGSFRELLHAISKDPAMIVYLDNQQNKKKAPNENFAREVMELFTLGEGQGYTETDIKEAARAFTGWHIDKRGDFCLNAKAHDEGSKTVFGKTGNWDGTDVVDMLLEKPETAQRIVTKVFRFFVNERPSPEIIDALAKRFRETDYNISDLMITIFGSSWFYKAEHKAAVIKSPAQLLVQYKRITAFESDRTNALVKVQEALGQVLFFPPNVAGWKGGRSWIDSTTLLTRMRLPGMLLTGTLPQVVIGPNNRKIKNKGIPPWGRGKVQADWRDVNTVFANSKNPSHDMLQWLITAPTAAVDKRAIQALEKTPAAMAVHIMALPEFQLA